jgi:zinc transport system substrate-binding protein
MFKKNKSFFLTLLVLFVAIAVFAWQNRSQFKAENRQMPDLAADKPQLLVTVLPQKQIVERIAGDDFEVTALVPPGFNPATYDPTPEEMKIISQADIYFRIGHVPFEKVHLDDIQAVNEDLKIVDTSINNELRMIEEHSHDEENHDEEEEEHDEEESIDPHLWLAPLMVKQQATVIKETLDNFYPEKTAIFEENYQDLVNELDQLDQDLAIAFAPIKGETMLVYHPAFGYLADQYGFIQEHIEIEGQEPSIAQLQEIIEEAKADNVRVVFVQAQFSQDGAKAIAENIDGLVVQINPLNPDYLGNLKAMAETISNNLK